ncbi:AMP-binding protein, partial [Kitasatospora nipponensis]|uniref:AMP-binding protein n=1 Tax=Kitasatospora nipponensis TaxID=258049 RepID=UPI0031E06139
MDLFDRETVESIAVALPRVLAQLVADPAGPVHGVDALSAEQRHLVLGEWNDTGVEFSAAVLPELFEAQVVRTPEVSAVVCAGVSLSFGELNARANRLARRLVAAGVGPERLVALALPRSVESVVALFAVLKAGGAFVPVDTDYPAERIARLLAVADTVVTDRATLGQLPCTEAVLVDDPDDGPAGNLGLEIHPNSAAYVIHTSGSTGEPKGV